MRMRHRTTRTQRVGIRRVGGPLKTVLDKTKKLYDVSLKLFCSWCAAHGKWPDSKDELDHAACQFLMHCWQEGETRAVVANLLSGIGNSEPSLKWHLAGTRRLYAAWVKRELGARCCPITWSMAEAIAGILLHWSWIEEGAMVLLLHHGLLRTMEGLNSRCGDYIFQMPLLRAHLSLPDTKTSKRHGRSESVSLYEAKVVKLLFMLCEKRQPGDKVYSSSPGTFRKRFALALTALGMDDLDIQIHSMRRGGATDYFKATNSMQEVAFRGRWANFTTAKLYTDGALQDRALMKLGDHRLSKAAKRRLHELLS